MSTVAPPPAPTASRSGALPVHRWIFGAFWLPNRLCLLAGVVTAELLVLTRTVAPIGPYLASPVLLLLTLFVLGRHHLARLILPPSPVRSWVLAAHLVALAVTFAAEREFLPHPAPVDPAASTVVFVALASAIISALLAATLFTARDIRHAFVVLLRQLPAAALVVALCLGARRLLLYLWDTPDSPPGRALQSVTFSGAAWVLRRFYSFIYTRTSDHVLGTRGFAVRITASCSGVESLGLMLVLGTAWLLYTRREIRLGRGLLLLPLALLFTWSLNVLRIASLIALGDSGHPHFAMTIYHSHAGWLLFNAAALAFVVVTQKLRWVRRQPA